MDRARTRRRVLAAIGAAASGLAGCGGRSGRSTTSGEARTSAKAADGVAKRATTTSGSDRWTIDPLEHDGRVGAYYYTWYRPGYPMASWTPAEPALGYYDSADETVINRHVTWAREHGIDWFVVSWARGASWDGGSFLEDHFLPAELGREIDVSVLYESDPELETRDGTIDFDLEANREQLRTDFRKFDDAYFPEPTYATLDGRPVLTMYAATDFGGDVSGALREATDAIDADPYLVACVLGAETVTGPMRNVRMDWLDAFDAVTGYNVYDRKAVAAAGGRFDAFLDAAERELTEWSLVADRADLAVIPDVTPGYDGTHISNRDHHLPVLERDPEGFRRLAGAALDHADPDLDAVLVTSFNEWPEYTAVEPSKSYGRTYLEVVRDELALGEPDYVRPERYPVLQLAFDPVLTPPQADGNLRFGMQLDTLTLLDGVGSAMATFDVGTPGEEPYVLEGAYPPKPPHGVLGRWRWLGGPTARTTFAFDPGLRGAATAKLRGMAPDFADRSIDVTVSFDGTETDSLTLGSDVETYAVSLRPH